jgi:hypothetical protein
MTPSLTPTVSYIYYSNTEYNTTEVFLDNNIYIRKNPSTDLVNDVFSTPGDVLITGNVIYQGDSIYAQSQGFTGGYPAPLYGTSTRTLNITDQAGNTVYNFTGDYTTYSNINTTFSIVGGRNYFVRGRTDFSWPTEATLSIQGMYIDYGVSQYYFQYFLNTAVDGDFTITANGGISADMYFGAGCSGGSEVNFGNSPSSTVIKGQYGYGFVTTGQSSTYGFSSYTLQNSLFVDGNFYQHGDTFVKGVTTVTVNIFTGCSPI